MTFEVDGEHGLFEIVHTKTLLPSPNPVTAVFGRPGFEIVPLPDTMVQIPVPDVAIFPFIVVVGEEIQSV